MTNALVPFGPIGNRSLVIRPNMMSTPACLPGGRAEPNPSLITGARPSQRGTGQAQRPVSCTMAAGCREGGSPAAPAVICDGAGTGTCGTLPADGGASTTTEDGGAG